MTISIVMLNTGNIIDISVKCDQRISTVLDILSERGYIKYDSKIENVFIRSWRFGDFVNPMMTFKQVDIFFGDILYIEVEKA